MQREATKRIVQPKFIIVILSVLTFILSDVVWISHCSADAATMQVALVTYAGLTVRSLPDTKFEELPESTDIALHGGEVILDVHKSVNVRCRDYRIAIKPGTMVLIRLDGEIVTVTVLWEEHVKSVKMTLPDKFSEAAVGDSIYVGPDVEKLYAFISEQPGRRKVLGSHAMPGKYALARMEGSLVPLLQNDELIRRLQDSSTPSDLRIYNKIYKMAACLNVVRGMRGR